MYPRVATCIAGVAFSLGLVGYAAAANLPVKARPAPTAHNWTGCHFGVNVGYGWGRSPGYSTTGNSTITFNGLGTATVPAGVQFSNGINVDGVNGGFQAGCDYQTGQWVLGIEGDFSWMNASGNAGPAIAAITTSLGVAGVNAADVWTLKTRWQSTARARLGYSFESWLVYVTGGAAWMKLDSSANLAGTGATSVSQSDVRSGWVVGLGTEYAINSAWSVRAEYLHVEIPTYTTFSPGNVVPPVGAGNGTFPLFESTKFTNDVVRLGLNYKFM